MDKIVFAIEEKNQASTIKVCLEALRKICYDNMEIILIDDGSIDNTCEIAAPYVDRIIIKGDQNNGLAGSRNIALELSQGAYLFIIDGDIEVTELEPEKIIAFLKIHSEVIALSGHYKVPNGVDDYNKLLDIRREKIFFKDKLTYIYGYHNYTTFSGGFCCINNTSPERVIRFQHHKSLHADDLLWQVELIKKGYKLAYYPELVGIHHHLRDHKHGFMKTVSEAKGNVWFTMALLSQKGFPPVLEQVICVPILFVAGILILFKSILLGVLFILFGVLPYLWIGISTAD